MKYNYGTKGLQNQVKAIILIDTEVGHKLVFRRLIGIYGETCISKSL